MYYYETNMVINLAQILMYASKTIIVATKTKEEKY